MTAIANRLLPVQGAKAPGGSAKAAIPRYRATRAPALLSAGFRPFFLLSAVWACIGIPLWLALYGGTVTLPTALPPADWHAHEMIFGFAAATVAGFLLTAIPNWTGRMPLQGWPLATLVLLWAAGRIGVLFSAVLGPAAAAVLDLLFPAAFLAVVTREILTGRNWRNLPMVGALTGLLLANALVHAAALGLADTAEFGNRFAIAILLLLISLVGGRIIPSFTRNWLVKQRPTVPAPVPANRFDTVVLSVTAVALAAWLLAPGTLETALIGLAAGLAHALRLSRWRGLATLREPLLWVLHLGYAWLAAGFCLLGLQIVVPWLPPFTALHALTVGAIGTMTLAVMTRATLGHTGRPLQASTGTTAIYLLVTVAALLRLLAPFAPAHALPALWLAGLAWSAAFGLFVLLYLPLLAQPRQTGKA
ncbi:MAG TPA: NnrS family protein [Acetobacteraceae bacterium]|nr:NnrS family protein [Acetobacteraceae bacterium]